MTTPMNPRRRLVTAACALTLALGALTGCGPEEQLDPGVEYVEVPAVFGTPDPSLAPKPEEGRHA